VREIPEPLLTRPFTRDQARELGVSKAMLAGSRFVRIHPRVWRHRDHAMSWRDEVEAAVLAMPPAARLTHATRIQLLGLEFGPRRPLHFVVEGELHLALDGIFLHRTKALAPTDDFGVLPSGAFVAYCSTAPLIDAISVGDWLLQHHHMAVPELVSLALAAPWRDGADEALLVLEWLDGRSRSVKESQLRAVLRAAGLPPAEPNRPIDLHGDGTVIADLVYADYGLVVEFEGGHHQEDRVQYLADIERFSLLRDHDVPYLQVTRESLARPRTLVGTVYRRLLSLGYVGPPPELGVAWRSLCRPVRELLPPRRTRLRELAAGRR
jgi:very-short-patch-repair endonuclease